MPPKKGKSKKKGNKNRGGELLQPEMPPPPGHAGGPIPLRAALHPHLSRNLRPGGPVDLAYDLEAGLNGSAAGYNTLSDSNKLLGSYGANSFYEVHQQTGNGGSTVAQLPSSTLMQGFDKPAAGPSVGSASSLSSLLGAGANSSSSLGGSGATSTPRGAGAEAGGTLAAQTQHLDPCHNGQHYRQSSICRAFAEREWNWEKLGSKAFNNFLATSEMGVDAEDRMEITVEEVLGLIEGVRCGYCKDRLQASLERVVSGDQPNGLYLTKHARLYLHRTGGCATSAASAVSRGDDGMAEGKWRDIVLKLSNGLGVEHIQQLQEQITAMCEPVVGKSSGGEDDSGSDTDATSSIGGYLSEDDWSAGDTPFPEREGYQSLSSDDDEELDSLGGALTLTGAWQSELASLFEGVHDFSERARDLGQAIQASLAHQTQVGEGGAGDALDPSHMEDRLAALDWNPKFAHLLSNADTTLGQWMRQITSVLLYLSRLDLLAFLSSREDRKEIRTLVEELWSGYEQALERLLKEATSSRREQLRDSGGTANQPSMVAFCFAARNRQQLAKLIQKKHTILDELHQMLIARCNETRVQSLFRRLSRVRQAYEKRLFTAEWCDLDAREDSALYQRLQFFSDNSFVATRNDLMAQEQQSDSQLKKAIAEWDTMLERVRQDTLTRARRDLAPSVYPQTLRLQRRVKTWQRRFDREWEELHQAQQLKARLSQQEVTRLQSQLHTTRQQLKSAKEQAALTAKKKRKEEALAQARGEDTVASSNTLGRAAFQNFGLMLLNDGDEEGAGEEGDERTSMLATLCLMTNQRQLEHCLKFRLFAARNTFQRHRLAREFYAQYRWRIMDKERQVSKLCGSEEEAAHRLRALVACHLLSRLDRACGRHTAERYERQLVEDAEREDLAAQRSAKRKNRRREQKQAQAQAAAALAAANAVLQQQEPQQPHPGRKAGGARGPGARQGSGLQSSTQVQAATAKGKPKALATGAKNPSPAAKTKQVPAPPALSSSSGSDSDSSDEEDGSDLTSHGSSLTLASEEDASAAAATSLEDGKLSGKGDASGSNGQLLSSELQTAAAGVDADDEEGWSVVGSRTKNRTPMKQQRNSRRNSKSCAKVESPASEAAKMASEALQKNAAPQESGTKAPSSHPPADTPQEVAGRVKGAVDTSPTDSPAAGAKEQLTRTKEGKSKATPHGADKGHVRTSPRSRATSQGSQRQAGSFADKSGARKTAHGENLKKSMAPGVLKRGNQGRPSSRPSSQSAAAPSEEKTAGEARKRRPQPKPLSAWVKPPAGSWLKGPPLSQKAAEVQSTVEETKLGVEETKEPAQAAAKEEPLTKDEPTPKEDSTSKPQSPTQPSTEQQEDKTDAESEINKDVQEEDTPKVVTVAQLRKTGQLKGGTLSIGAPLQNDAAKAARERAARERAERERVKKEKQKEEKATQKQEPAETEAFVEKPLVEEKQLAVDETKDLDDGTPISSLAKPLPDTPSDPKTLMPVPEEQKTPLAQVSFVVPATEPLQPEPEPEQAPPVPTDVEEEQICTAPNGQEDDRAEDAPTQPEEEEKFVIQFGGFGLDSSDDSGGEEIVPIQKEPKSDPTPPKPPLQDVEEPPSPSDNSPSLTLEVQEIPSVPIEPASLGKNEEEKPRVQGAAVPPEDSQTASPQKQPSVKNAGQGTQSIQAQTSQPLPRRTSSSKPSSASSPLLSPMVPPLHQGVPVSAGVPSPGGSLLTLPSPLPLPQPHQPPPGATMVPVPIVGQPYSQPTLPQAFVPPTYAPQAGMPQPVQYAQLPGRGLTPQGYLATQGLHIPQQRPTHHPQAPHLHPQHHHPAGPGPPHTYAPQFRPSAPEWVPQGYAPTVPPSSFSGPQQPYMQSHAQPANPHQHAPPQAQSLLQLQYFAYLQHQQQQQQQMHPPHPHTHGVAPVGPTPGPGPPPQQVGQSAGQAGQHPVYLSGDAAYYQSQHQVMYQHQQQQPARMRYPSHEYEYARPETPENHGGGAGRRRFSSGPHQPQHPPAGGPGPNGGHGSRGYGAAQQPQQQPTSGPQASAPAPIPPTAVVPDKPHAQNQETKAQHEPSTPDEKETSISKKSEEASAAQVEDQAKATSVEAKMEQPAADGDARPPASTLETDKEGEAIKTSSDTEVPSPGAKQGEPLSSAIEIPSTPPGNNSTNTEAAWSNESPARRAFPRGLSNATGQNNCFLNVVVQSLWHLDAFRDRFWQAAHAPHPQQHLPPAHDPPNTTALPTVAMAEEDSERIRQALTAVFRGLSGHPSPDDEVVEDKEEGVVSVDALRKALSQSSAASAQLFGAGHMDDAVEALEVVLGSLPADLQGIVQETFCMNIQEVLECPRCGGLTPQPPNSYGTNTFYVPVKSLQEVHSNNPDANFSQLLKLSGRGDLYLCQNSACTIHRRADYLPSERRLLGAPPRVFSLGFVWESLQASSESIAKVLASFESTVDLNVVLSADSANENGPEIAQIRGFFCFQSHKHHYIAFFFNSEIGQWFIYDDATIKQVGPNYSHVINICAQALLQPLIVFFEVVKYYSNLQPMEKLSTDYNLGQSSMQIGKEEKATTKIGKSQQDNLSLNSLVTSGRRRHKHANRKRGSGK